MEIKNFKNIYNKFKFKNFILYWKFLEQNKNELF